MISQRASSKMLRLCIFIGTTALLGKSDAAFSALSGRVTSERRLLTSSPTDGAQLLATEDSGVEQRRPVASIPSAILPAGVHHATAFIFVMAAALAVAFLVKNCFGGIKSDGNTSSERRLALGDREDDPSCSTAQGEEKPTTSVEPAVKPKDPWDWARPDNWFTDEEITTRVINGVFWELVEKSKVAILEIEGDIMTKDAPFMNVDGVRWKILYRAVGDKVPLSGNRRVKEGLVPKIINKVYFELDEKDHCLIKEIPGRKSPKDVVTRIIDGVQYHYKYMPIGKGRPVSGHARVGKKPLPIRRADEEEEEEAKYLIHAKVKGVEYYVDEAKKIAYPKRHPGDGPLSSIKLGGEKYEVKSDIPADAFLEGHGPLKPESHSKKES